MQSHNISKYDLCTILDILSTNRKGISKSVVLLESLLLLLLPSSLVESYIIMACNLQAEELVYKETRPGNYRFSSD